METALTCAFPFKGFIVYPLVSRDDCRAVVLKSHPLGRGKEKGNDTFKSHPLGWEKGKANNTFKHHPLGKEKRWGRTCCKITSFFEGGEEKGNKVYKSHPFWRGEREGESRSTGRCRGPTYQFTSVASSLTRLYASLHASLSILVAMGAASTPGKGRGGGERGAARSWGGRGRRFCRYRPAPRSAAQCRALPPGPARPVPPPRLPMAPHRACPPASPARPRRGGFGVMQ